MNNEKIKVNKEKMGLRLNTVFGFAQEVSAFEENISYKMIIKNILRVKAEKK